MSPGKSKTSRQQHSSRKQRDSVHDMVEQFVSEKYQERKKPGPKAKYDDPDHALDRLRKLMERARTMARGAVTTPKNNCANVQACRKRKLKECITNQEKTNSGKCEDGRAKKSVTNKVNANKATVKKPRLDAHQKKVMNVVVTDQAKQRKPRLGADGKGANRSDRDAKKARPRPGEMAMKWRSPYLQNDAFPLGFVTCTYQGIIGDLVILEDSLVFCASRISVQIRYDDIQFFNFSMNCLLVDHGGTEQIFDYIERTTVDNLSQNCWEKLNGVFNRVCNKFENAVPVDDEEGNFLGFLCDDQESWKCQSTGPLKLKMLKSSLVPKGESQVSKNEVSFVSPLFSDDEHESPKAENVAALAIKSLDSILAEQNFAPKLLQELEEFVPPVIQESTVSPCKTSSVKAFRKRTSVKAFRKRPSVKAFRKWPSVKILRKTPSSVELKLRTVLKKLPNEEVTGPLFTLVPKDLKLFPLGGLPCFDLVENDWLKDVRQLYTNIHPIPPSLQSIEADSSFCFLQKPDVASLPGHDVTSLPESIEADTSFCVLQKPGVASLPGHDVTSLPEEQDVTSLPEEQDVTLSPEETKRRVLRPRGVPTEKALRAKMIRENIENDEQGGLASLTDKENAFSIARVTVSGFKVEIPVPTKGGRGVAAAKLYKPKDFICEYQGELVAGKTGYAREQSLPRLSGCYLYFFKHADKGYCVDATKDRGHMGRLINHGGKRNLEANAVTKLCEIDGLPHLYFEALREIQEGEEILYDYGDYRPDIRKAYPWLFDQPKGKGKQQMSKAV